MTRVVEIDEREITITPFFKLIEVENVPKSEVSGFPVMEMKEVVEVRFAGQKNYAPIFPTDAFWKREGNQVLTYAERWPEQYRQFKEGSPQEAMGTPLEMLRQFGITPEQLSLCRALKIYSIEALNRLEGSAVKALGMNANRLKEAARDFLAQRGDASSALSEIEALRAEIAALRAERSTIVPVQEPSPAEVDAIVKAADDAFADLSDTQIKDELEKLMGARPKGNPSRATLVSMLETAMAA